MSFTVKVSRFCLLEFYAQFQGADNFSVYASLPTALRLNNTTFTLHEVILLFEQYYKNDNLSIVKRGELHSRGTQSNDRISLLISSFLPSRKTSPWVMTSHTLINTTFARSNLQCCMFIFRLSHWYRQVMRELSTIWLYMDATIRLTEITCSITRI